MLEPACGVAIFLRHATSDQPSVSQQAESQYMLATPLGLWMLRNRRLIAGGMPQEDGIRAALRPLQAAQSQVCI